MIARTVDGLTFCSLNPLPKQTEITIRAERTEMNGKEITSLSLTDESVGFMIFVDYEEVEKVIRGLKK